MNQSSLNICFVFVVSVAASAFLASVSCDDTERAIRLMIENEKEALESDSKFLLGIADRYMNSVSPLRLARARLAINSHLLRTIEYTRKKMINDALVQFSGSPVGGLKSSLLDAHQRAFVAIGPQFEKLLETNDPQTIVGDDVTRIEQLFVKRIEQIKSLNVPEAKNPASQFNSME